MSKKKLGVTLFVVGMLFQCLIILMIGKGPVSRGLRLSAGGAPVIVLILSQIGMGLSIYGACVRRKAAQKTT